MSVAATIRAMVAAGLTYEQALVAIEAVEQNMKTKDEQAERRRAKDRERKRRIPRNSADSAESAEPSPTPLSVSSNEDTKQKTNAPTRERVKRPAVIDAEWRPSERGMAYAAEKGLSPAEIETEVEKIRNWSISQRKTAVDWDRSWMNWVINAVQRLAQSGARNDRNARHPQRPESHPGPRRKHTMASVELEEQAWAAARERSGPVGFDSPFDERGTLDFGPVGASAFGLDGGGNGSRAQGRPDASVVRLHVAGGR